MVELHGVNPRSENALWMVRWPLSETTRSMRPPVSQLHAPLHESYALSGEGRDVAGQPTFPIRGEGQRRPNVVAFKIREIREDFILRHAAGQIIEDVVDRDAQPAQARLAAALAWLDGDPLPIVHVLRMCRRPKARIHGLNRSERLPIAQPSTDPLHDLGHGHGVRRVGVVFGHTPIQLISQLP
jgi:hypothetical protein